MTPELAAVAFGLFASLSWGVSDFSGGVATRRITVMGVVAVAHGVGLLLLVGLALLSHEPLPPVSDMLWGILAGLAGLVGMAALYRALAVGRMGIVAPTAAVLSAALAAGFGMLAHGLPPQTQLLGFAIGIGSIWAVSYSSGGSREMRGFGLAVLAGVSFAGFLILIDRVASDTLFWPLVGARAASVSVMLAAVFLSRRNWLPHGERQWLIVILAGALDVAGNVFFMLATQAGRLDIAAVVSSLYPAITVLLARLVLKEQVTRLQTVGLVAAVAAISLITVG